MMKSIREAISARRERGDKALIPFLTAGFPTRELSMQSAAAVCESGADVVEIGFPHSDPLADGPIIQKSSHIALQAGFTTAAGLSMIRELATSYPQPFVIMGYYNPILQFGIQRFARAAARAGIKGLIVPDLIVEECHELRLSCLGEGIDLILLVTPTTPADRIEQICTNASGFVYYVSVTGVTGARTDLHGDLEVNVNRIRRYTALPVCVGFGISSPQDASVAAKSSDGVIIGSRLLSIVESETSRTFPQLRQFITEVRMKLGGRT